MSKEFKSETHSFRGETKRVSAKSVTMWNQSIFHTIFSILIVFISLMNMVEVEGLRSRVPKEKEDKGPPVFDVKLYTMRQYEGKMVRLKIQEGACVNLPSSWEKQVSSVDPSGCVILYADQDCRGFRKRLDKWSFGSTNLKDIAFDSKLSSLSTCPTLKKPVIDEL